jgi:hypothetical protein
MHHKIYDLFYDFIQQQGTFMTMYRGEYLQENDMAVHQVKMLQYHSIPRILKIELEQIDHRYKLLYHITGKRMLSAIFKSRKLSLFEYFSLLNHITSVLVDSKKYLLHENRYILDEQFIFVGLGLDDIYLTYLPLHSISNKGNLQAEFRQLATKLIGYIDEISGDRIQQFMNFLKDENFSLPELKKLLNHLLQSDFGGQLKNDSADILHSEGNESKNVQVAQISKKPNFSVRYVIAASLLSMMISWALYAMYQEELVLLLAVSITLLALIIFTVYRRSPSFDVLFKTSLPHVVEVIEAAPIVNEKKRQAAESDIVQDYGNHVLQTTLLSKLEATTLLSSEQMNADMKKSAYLEVKHHQRTERIRLEGGSLTIGRGPSQEVHFVDNQIGVSRMHCEIMKWKEAYCVKDLGSINGTYLNDERLVPYKLYDLQSGDVIKIICNEYIYIVE